MDSQSEMNLENFVSDKIEEAEMSINALRLSCNQEIVDSALLIVSCFNNGGKVLICGNGGSAADSQHFAAEFVSSFSKKIKRRSYPAIALTTDTSVITSYANDFSFDDIFARQIESLGQKDDILIVFTTSGSSGNCLSAVDQAKKQGLKTLAFTCLGGEITKKVDLSIRVPSNDTQHIQECHVVAYHIIAGLVEELMSSRRVH
jgi:D-sedoheptulose 7-phosphate isomerase